MPGEDAITGTLNDPMDQKGRTRHRWREKLPRWDSKATQDDRSRNQDIQSFLHAPNNEQAVVTTSDLGSPPKISSPDEKYVSNHVSPSPSRRKSPRKPDLHVEFAATAPVIIGEGGDEAALPVTELLSSLALFSNLPVEASEAGIQPLVTVFEQVHVKEQSNPDNSFRPKSLERRSTGLRDHDSNVHPMQAAEPTSWRRDQAMPRDDVPGILPAQSTRRDSPGGQQNALVNGNPIDGTAPTSHIDTLDVEWPRGDGGRQESSSAPLQLNLLDPATSFANSLSPLPSPQPRRSPYSSSDSSPSFAATQITDILPSNSAYTKVADSKAQHLPQGISASPLVEARDLSLRNIVKGFAEDALLEFASRVRPYCSVFLLGLGSGIEPTLQQWVIAATWWFLKGRIELENSVRSRPRSIAAQDPTQVDIPRELKQAFIDLAKSWWIVTEMAPARHPEVRRLENRGPVSLPTIMHSFVDARTTELIQAYHSIVSNLRALTMSMKRNSKLPPHGMELQGLDVRIFVAYPSLSPSAARLLSLENLKIVAGDRPAETASFFPMPIADTERHFNYGRMFVDLVINEGNTGHQISMPCLLSMLRDKKKRDISVVVASQDGQVQLFIQPEANTPISWQDVHWKVQHRAIEIDVRADFIVRIQLSERDFKTVWGVHDYTRSVQKQSQGLKDEVLIYEKILRSFQYLEGGNGAAQFPTEPVKGCKLRLFECFTIATEGVGRRKTHDGYRLMVVTPRSVKTLNSVNRDIGRQLPIVFNFLRDERKAPALLLKMSKSSRDPSMVMSFEQEADREHFYSLLNGTKMSIDEFCSDILPLKHCGVSTDMEQEPASNNQIRILDRLHWQRLQVLGQRGQQMELGGPVTRICAECDMGSLVDRINIGPGELQLRLDTKSLSRIEILRAPQTDMTVCFADNTLSKEQHEDLRQMLDYIARSPSLRVFQFPSVNDLHTFQALTTGFSVVFDGFAKAFSISRRRMVVPIYKRWEASETRLQIVRHEKTFQLVAFFRDFNHGSCMNFVLKSTDIFESFTRSGTSYLCIVDAKFALPKEGEDPKHRFVSLGMPEYPGEHDDITIGFQTDQERDVLIAALPAPVNQLSRLSSLRR